MKLVKERFLKTELGGEMQETVKAIDFYLTEQAATSEWREPEKYQSLQENIDILFAKWEVFKLAVKQFYGIEYHFTRTDEYYGLCTEDEGDYLIKIVRTEEKN